METKSFRTTEREKGYRESGAWTDERLGSLLDKAVERWPDREYVSFEGRRFTFAQFNRWVEAIAADFVARGVVPGDRAFIQVPNRLEALALQLAAFRIGVVNVPVIPIYREHEIRVIIEDCQPAIVAVASSLGTRTPPDEIDAILADSEHSVAVKYAIGDSVEGWFTLPGPDSPQIRADLPEPADAGEPAIILYTSGTTSRSKGAVLSSRECIAHARSWVKLFGVREDDVFLVGIPLSHLGGFNSAILLPLHSGARIVVMPNWKPLAAAEVAEREGVTIMMGASLFLSDMLDIYESGQFASRPIRLYPSAGAATAPSLIHRAAAFGIVAGRCYGMTEAGTLTGFDASDSVERRAEYDGRLFEGISIEAVDEHRRPLPAGVDGELRVRGPQVMDRYTDPVASAQQLDEDGWFYTGDIGSVSEDGWLRMTGRIKDIINRGGEKFSAQDIEFAIKGHPDIAEVAVVPLPDARFGECVGAFVALREGISWEGPDDLLAYLDAHGLAKQKLPVIWHVLPEGLPHTASGKIQKNLLVELHGRENV